MAEKKQNDRKLLQKLKNKYRLSIYNDSTFEEVWYIRLSPMNVLALSGTLLIVFMGLFYLLVAYTSIREFIPGYPDANMVRNIMNNASHLDSLETQIDQKDAYIKNLSDIIAGKVPDLEDTSQARTEVNKKVEFTRSVDDSLMRQKIESEEQYNLMVTGAIQTKQQSLPVFHFFKPVNGLVTNGFKPDEDHYGTDIVCAPNELVKAVLDGTVILANWTLETGYVIEIQHDNNLVSIYKHNSELLKKVGNRVKAGEGIAIVGNSGEYTTGPHLHFELWHDGIPKNPEDYIAF